MLLWHALCYLSASLGSFLKEGFRVPAFSEGLPGFLLSSGTPSASRDSQNSSDIRLLENPVQMGLSGYESVKVSGARRCR